MSILHVVSMSGGKDSTATAILALETQPRESLRFVFADTGNEHEATYEYIGYLEGALGIEIVRLKADFTDWWWHRYRWVAEHGPKKHGQAATDRMLAVFAKGPTGNPYLDLCMIKGRFPSRRAQFCTLFLKTMPLVDWQMDLVLNGEADAVWSWQGVRADESANRRWLPEFEEKPGGIWAYRPILRWTAADCFEAHRCYGIEPNPLYRLGMNRVGCMPCINCSKAEIANIAQRFPEHIDRVAEWEEAVSAASWRGAASFFPAPDDGRGDLRGRNIRDYVEWAKTSHGGRQYDMAHLLIDGDACSSAYGLCE